MQNHEIADRRGCKFQSTDILLPTDALYKFRYSYDRIIHDRRPFFIRSFILFSCRFANAQIRAPNELIGRVLRPKRLGANWITSSWTWALCELERPIAGELLSEGLIQKQIYIVYVYVSVCVCVFFWTTPFAC